MATEIFYEPYVQVDPVDLGFAKAYFDTLPDTDINKKFYNGQKYTIQTNPLSRLANFFTIHSKLHTLEQFYPHQRQIKATVEQMKEDRSEFTLWAAKWTAFSWFCLYQYARKGQVFPAFKLYGTFFKTHRLFRQYAYTFAVPWAYTIVSYDHKWNDHIEVLWKTHANRLNNHILSDPNRSDYPEELRKPLRRVFENLYYK